MGTLINISGQRFGKLIAIDRVGVRNNKATWLCKCTCGKWCIYPGCDLKAGNTTSCGCARGAAGREAFRNKRKDRKQTIISDVFRSASRRKIAITLSGDEIISLASLPCHYCGEPPEKRPNGVIKSGIDRLNSDEGYHLANCVPCCRKCNFSKQRLSEFEFLTHIEKIYKYRCA